MCDVVAGSQGEARMDDFENRNRRDVSHRVDGGAMVRQLDSGEGASDRDTRLSAALQAAVVSEDGRRGGAGDRGAGASSSVDLVALVKQWTLSLRRLVSALLSARHGASGGGGATFKSLQGWIPELGSAAELLTQRVSNARMLVSQLQRLCPELAASIEDLNAEIAACEAAVGGAGSRRAAATPSRGGASSRDHLAMATPAGAYGPRSLAAFHTRARGSAPGSASRGRAPATGSSAAGLMTAIRPTKRAHLASTTRKATSSMRPRLSPHAELSPATESHSGVGGAPAAGGHARGPPAGIAAPLEPGLYGRTGTVGDRSARTHAPAASGARVAANAAAAVATPAHGAGTSTSLVRHLTFGED